MDPRERIILALDFPSPEIAWQVIHQIGPDLRICKVGLELFLAGGKELVRELHEAGKQVFLDLKFYDIPETVKRAVIQAVELQPRFLTVHGNRAILQAAVDGRGAARWPQILAVTVLTSLDEDDLREMGLPCKPEELVRLRARNAKLAGVDGVVASAHEVEFVREEVGHELIIVTPGIRSVGRNSHDQKRVMTPAEAVRRGSDYLVVGRQVTRAADPRAEFLRIVEEISSVA